MRNTKFYQAIGLLFAISAILVPDLSLAQTTWETRSITFPIIGAASYGDDFGNPRDGGARTHEGNDLLGRKMQPLVAAVDGELRRVVYPEASYGYAVVIEDADGYTYHYLHMNNDTPGTDNGEGGGANAYAVDIYDRNRVVAGQLIGWMGDSGNAETGPAHLHFEIRRPDRTPISPYNSLKAATKLAAPVAERPIQEREFLPFGNFEGGASLAAADTDDDGEAELLIGAQAGGGPRVVLANQDGTELFSFFPYDPNFRGGVNVALGDVDGDFIPDIITAPGRGGGPHVKVFDLAGTELSGFMAYDPGFLGGVNLAVADMNGDGVAEIITAPKRGGGPHVRVFNMYGMERQAFFAYDPAFAAGIDVAAYGDDEGAYIATVPDNGGGPHVKIFDPEGELQSEFMAYDETHQGGVRIAFAQTNRDDEPEVITVPLNGGPHLRAFDLLGTDVGQDWEFEPWWHGSWEVAAFEDELFVSNGPDSRRRTSVRQARVNTSFFDRN